MIDGATVLAVIPARGGSKGLARKNILSVQGRPLLAWSFEAARRSRYIDRVVLSTEDPQILSVGRALGIDVPYVRPKELASDEATLDQVLAHLLREVVVGYDYIVLLQATSPLRTDEDIDGCIECCVRRGAGACVSVNIADKSPFFYRAMDQDSRLRPVLGDSCAAPRRQEMPVTYMLNGAVFVANTGYYLQHETFLTQDTLGYVMPKNRSLDIDNEFDLSVMHALIAHQAQDR